MKNIHNQKIYYSSFSVKLCSPFSGLAKVVGTKIVHITVAEKLREC